MRRKKNRIARVKLGEKIIDLGNFSFIGIVITQAFPDEYMTLRLFIGVTVISASYIIGFHLMKGGE